MSLKSFFIKKTLQFKGVPKEQAEEIANQISANPELTASLKALEANKEVKELFEKIQKDIEEKKKGGMQEMYAAVSVMEKYKSEIAKHREELAPLMKLMGK